MDYSSANEAGRNHVKNNGRTSPGPATAKGRRRIHMGSRCQIRNIYLRDIPGGKSRGMVDTAAVPKKIYISSCLDMNTSHFVVQPFQRNLVIRLQGGDLAVLFRSQTEQPEDLIAWDLWRLHIESIAQYHRMLSVGFGDSTPTALLQSFECCEIHARYDPFKPRWVVMHSSSS